MPKTAEYYRQYRALRKAMDKPVPRGTDKRRARPFIAVDGEGWTLSKGRHVYTLLGASDGTSISAKTGLSTADCFDYLLDLKRRHKTAIFVGFAFNYDVNMILSDLSWDELKRLHTEGWTLAKIGRDWWRIEHRPMKWTRISRASWKTGRYEALATISIYDTFGFFQSSFATAMRDMKVIREDSDQYRELVEMKQLRGRFTAAQLQRIKDYNQLECELLVDAMTELRAGMDAIGLKPSGWHGAGAVAAGLLKAHEVKDHIAQPPEHLQEHVMRAYFGGRIQTVQMGEFAPAFSHDLRSAYPAALVELPSLSGGIWKPAKWQTRNPVALYRVRWDLQTHRAPFGPLPFRRPDGSIIFPIAGEGWYWQPEAAAALAAFPSNVEILDGYQLSGHDRASRPFAWVRELYHERARLKAEGQDAAQKALKLGLNSLYGKLAQGVGLRGELPAYQCYIYSGLITAITRAKLLEAAIWNPDSIISFATDGIYATEPLPIDVGDELGEWESEALDEFFILQAGVYRYVKDGKATLRTRGFKPSELDFDGLRREWYRVGPGIEYPIKTTRFIGLGTALMRNAPELWQQWPTEKRIVSAHSDRYNWPLSFTLETLPRVRAYPVPYPEWPQQRKHSLSEPYAGGLPDNTDERKAAGLRRLNGEQPQPLHADFTREGVE